jgi:hypothetical protein
MSDPIIASLQEAFPEHLLEDVKKEFLQGFAMNRVRAETEAKQIAQFGHSNEAKHIDGVGRLVAKIPPDSFYYWSHILGPQCWEDKQFLREFLRDNPEVAVRNYTKKTVVNGTIFDSGGFIAK